MTRDPGGANRPLAGRGGEAAAEAEFRSGNLAAVALWRSMLADVGEWGFTELAGLLRDRPRPPKRTLDAAAEAARNAAGPDRVPAWAHALLESVIAAERLVAHFQARAASDLAELAGSYPGLREHLSTEIAVALGCSEASATNKLTEAEETAARLPGTVAARWRGILPTCKVTALRTETANVTDEVALQVETDVLPAAPRQTVPELRAAIRRSILRHDPDGAEIRHRSALARRRASRWSLPEGMGGMQIISSATDIAAIGECLDAVAALAKTPGDPRTTDQRRVDALVDICTDILESGQYQGHSLPRPHRRRPQVHVTMPLDALVGANPPCELAGYGPITADQARTIAADGELRRMVCDPLSGVLLDYGRTVYEPPQSLADHVLARDQMCTAPGCRRTADRCEIDHTVPYPAGPTSAENLRVLCKHHHRGKDGGGSTVHRHDNGWTTWTTPMGHQVHTPPRRLWHPRPGDPHHTVPDQPPTNRFVRDRPTTSRPETEQSAQYQPPADIPHQPTPGRHTSPPPPPPTGQDDEPPF